MRIYPSADSLSVIFEHPNGNKRIVKTRSFEVTPINATALSFRFYGTNGETLVIPAAEIEDNLGAPVGDTTACMTYLESFINFTAGGGGGGGGDATAANQTTQISLAQSQFEKNSTLVQDTVTGELLERVILRSEDGLNTDTVLYYSASGTPIVPVNPVQFYPQPEPTVPASVQVSALKNAIFNCDYTIGSKRDDLWTEHVEAGGDVLINASNSTISLITDIQSGSAATRRTKAVIPSRTGDPTIVTMEAKFQAGSAGLEQLVGVGILQGAQPRVPNEGLFFGTTKNGFVITTRENANVNNIGQAAWNIDPMDGSGVSGITLDYLTWNTYYIKYLWRYGYAIFGVVINGESYDVHRIDFGNFAAIDYSINNGQLYFVNITKTDTSALASTLEVGACAAFAENGTPATGRTVSGHIYNPANATYANDPTLGVPVVAARLKAGFENKAYLLKSFQLASNGGAMATYQIRMNPQLRLNGANISWDSLTWRSPENSAIEFAYPRSIDLGDKYDIVSSIFGDQVEGDLLRSGVLTTTSTDTPATAESMIRLGSQALQTAADYRDVLVLTVVSSSADTFLGSLTFVEG